MSRTKDVFRLVVASVALTLAAATQALGEDRLKVAGAQRGAWETAAAQLGEQAGIFAKYGIALDLEYLDDVNEIKQEIIAGKADIGLGVGTMSAMQAFALGAPIRIIGATMAGSVNYWYVPKSSLIRTYKDLGGKTVAYERNGSSSQYDAIDFMRKLRLKAKLVPTGGAAATYERLTSEQGSSPDQPIDVGWAAPPFGLNEVEQGVIRIVGRASDVPRIRNKTVGVMIAHADALKKRRDALVRFAQAYRETVDWMYSDPAALRRFAELAGVSEAVARRVRDGFFSKDMIMPDRVVGLRDVMKDAVVFRYIQKKLSRRQMATLVQLVVRAPNSGCDAETGAGCELDLVAP